MRGSHKRLIHVVKSSTKWVQGNSGRRLTADTEVLFPADIYLCLGIPSWTEEVTTNRRNLHWPLYANLTFLHLPGGEHLFTFWLPGWIGRRSESKQNTEKVKGIWLMTVITGIAILMWQLTDIHPRQMNWQKICACATVFFHMSISSPSDGQIQRC